ncbi:MAG TPA: PAS domain-containing protein [Stellaceae bacterium]|nr:PAS domain-containing protein [Stellaceae bacterium]
MSARPFGDPSSIKSADLLALYELWLARRRGRRVPGRADFDPGDIPGRLWPLVMMVDVCREPERIRFRYRRVGMSFVEALGRDPTGLFLDEVLAVQTPHADYVAGLYLRMIADRRPIYSENIFTVDGKARGKLTRRLLLPLSRDGEEVDMAMVGHVFEYDPSWASAPRSATLPSVQEILPDGVALDGE